MMDSHNLSGDEASMRAYLLASADLSLAAGYAQALTNDIVEHINNSIDARKLTSPTAILSKALMARALIDLAAHWWSDMGPTSATKLPITTAVLRSFITDLPPELTGEAIIPDEQED